MMQTFKYRIYPTKEQKKALEKRLEEARFLYNKLLEASIKSYKEGGINACGDDTSTSEKAEASITVEAERQGGNGI